MSLLKFVRRVMSFIHEWDGRIKPTRMEIERIHDWWCESPDSCPEAVAMDIRFIYPSAESMRAIVNGKEKQP